MKISVVLLGPIVFLSALFLHAPSLRAGEYTFGPFPDYKGTVKTSVSLTISTKFTKTISIPFDGTIRISINDKITVKVTVPVPVFVPTYITVVSSVGVPFNQETDNVLLTDIFALDMAPDLDPEGSQLTGFHPLFPELEPLPSPCGDEFFIGNSGTEYQAHLNITIPIGELQDFLGPQYDLSAFLGGDPGSIVYVSQTWMPGWELTPQTCGDPGTRYMLADLDRNCYVNWGDFSVFASQWLYCTDPANPGCDSYWLP